MLSGLVWLARGAAALLLSSVRWLLSPVPLAVLALLATAAYWYFTRKFDFWRSRGVRGPTARVPWGSEWSMPGMSLTVDMDRWLYYEHGGKRFCGYFEFARPVLFVGDLDLIRAITIKDFEHFSDMRQVDSLEMFREMLSGLSGKQWKDTRAVMSPTFSASKLKGMHDVTLRNAGKLTDYVMQQMKTLDEVDIKDAFGKFTMDNIASCAFGVDCNSFNDPNSPFIKHAASLFAPDMIQTAYFMAAMSLPSVIAKRLPDPLAPCMRFFSGVVNKTIAHRKTSTTPSRDFLQLLLDTRDKEGHRVLSDSSVLSQCNLFFIAGYDTTATLLTFVAYCMATEPEWQRRVQEEIDAVVERHGGHMSYEAVMELSVLDRVLAETLRLYSPATRMERECTKEYTLPGTRITIPPGTLVQMPVFLVHRDPDNYPQPLKFDPDRHLPEQKEKRHPSAFLAFGSGPRNCIAMRFALFEAKVALAALLREVMLVPAASTPPPPCPLDQKRIITSPVGGTTPLRAVRRDAQ